MSGERRLPGPNKSSFLLRSISKNSKTKYILFGHIITSFNKTTFGCSISLNTDISLMVVLGTPSDYVSSLIYFKAIISPVL